MRNTFPIILFAAAAASLLAAETVVVQTELTEVIAKPLEKTTVIPGELKPYQRVDIHAKVTGFVEAIHVDRGSFVKQGQALAEMSAPEFKAQRVEAQAKIAAVVARPAYAVDSKTRTMPVELDVTNSGNKLTPGMYAEVAWPVRRGGESLFVPPTAIKATTERIFVIRVSNGKAEWVNIRRGISEGDLVEVFGQLEAGDRIVLRATDETRPGTRIQPLR